MESHVKFFIVILFIFTLYGEKTCINAHKCSFPAIFNFGDSNSDTGAAYSLGRGNKWPNGITLGKNFKRASDGLLIIDYIAKSLGLPYLNAFLDKNATSFRYGANFAVSGQRVNPFVDPRDPHNWEYHLDKQISQFFDLKSRAIACKDPEAKNIYPNPKAFSEALYTFDIGQNDVNSVFDWGNASTIVNYFTNSVKRLLNDGAKYLWVHNTGPLGCLPYIANYCPPMLSWNCTVDKFGCKTLFLAKSQEFNAELKKSVFELRKEYPKAAITLVDIYSAKNNLILKNKHFNKELRFERCCGNGPAFCATTAIVNNKTIFGGSCKNPSKYISWDGTHYTQASNKIIAKQIIRGDSTEPHVKLSYACRPKGKN